MKNNYLIAFLAASMALAGCSKSEVIGSEEPIARHSIGFSTYANESKALPITGNTGGANDFQKADRAFGVTAFFKDGIEPYMGKETVGTEIKYTTTPKPAWNYAKPEDVCFWPTTTAGSTDKLRFYAYAPFTSANTTARVDPAFTNATPTKEMKFTGYTVPNAVANQDDFMYATAEAAVQPTGNTDVKLTFAHALTQIHFSARTQATNLKVEIAANGIQVCNIGSVGTFTLTPTPTPTAAWSTTIGTPIDYTIPSEATSSATPIGYHATNYTPIDNATANVLMLIPQKTIALVPVAGTAIATQNGSYFSINCKIYQQNGTTGAKTYLHGTDAAYAMLYVPFAANWTMAQSVTYQLTFGGGYDAQGNPILEPITFTTDVTVWGNNTNIKQ